MDHQHISVSSIASKKRSGCKIVLHVLCFIKACLSVFCGIILPISQVFLSCQLVGIENFSSPVNVNHDYSRFTTLEYKACTLEILSLTILSIVNKKRRCLKIINLDKCQSLVGTFISTNQIWTLCRNFKGLSPSISKHENDFRIIPLLFRVGPDTFLWMVSEWIGRLDWEVFGPLSIVK